MSDDKNFEEAAQNELNKKEEDGGLFEKAADDKAKETPVESGKAKKTNLGKSSDWKKKNPEETVSGEYKMGWHNLDPRSFPSKGLFYPEEMKIQIRPATVKEIRQFSVVQDDDPFSIDEAMNHIMSSCSNVNIKEKISNFKDILEEDRIHMVLAIKDLTFVKGENALQIPLECHECDTAQEIEFCNDSLKPGTVDDKIMRYFDMDEKLFNIRTKSSGEFTIKPPCIGVMKVITQWIKEQSQTPGQRRKLDQGFIKCLPFLVHDWRGFNIEKIKELQMEFASWNATKYSTIFQLVDLIKIGVDEKVHGLCKSCGAEIHVPISFPRGIKSLFVVSDLAGELL